MRHLDLYQNKNLLMSDKMCLKDSSVKSFLKRKKKTQGLKRNQCVQILKNIKNQIVKYNFKNLIYIFHVYHPEDKKYALLNKIINQNLSLTIPEVKNVLLARSPKLDHINDIQMIIDLGFDCLRDEMNINGSSNKYKNYISYLENIVKQCKMYKIKMIALINEKKIDQVIELLKTSHKFPVDLLVPSEIIDEFKIFMKSILNLYDENVKNKTESLNISSTISSTGSNEDYDESTILNNIDDDDYNDNYSNLYDCDDDVDNSNL